MNSFQSESLPAETQVDNYRVVRAIASDGLSTTYDAVERNSGEAVCLREFFPHHIVMRGVDGVSVMARSAEDAPLFARELSKATEACRTLTEVSDRGLVGFGPSIEEHGTCYQVTRPQGLVTLRSFLTSQHHPVTATQLTTLMQRLLKTVRTLHDAGLVHGAISPATVLVNQQLEPFLHISLFDADGNRSTPDAASAAYLYESEPSIALDLYALGASFYHCVAGVGPVELAVRQEEIASDEDDPMMSAVELGGGAYPKTALQSIDWLLATDNSDRPVSADEVLQVVSGFAKIGKRGRVNRRSNRSGDPRLEGGGRSWRWLFTVAGFGALAGASWLAFVTLLPWVTDQFVAQSAPKVKLSGTTSVPAKTSETEQTITSVIQPPRPEPVVVASVESSEAELLTQNSDEKRINQYREQLEREELEKQIQARVGAAVQAKISQVEAAQQKKVQDRRDKANKFVAVADVSLGKGELLQPDGGALSLYRLALREDSDNVEAFGGVVAVASALADRATDALKENDLTAAEKWVAVSESVFTEQPSLPKLRQQIEARKKQQTDVVDKQQSEQLKALNDKVAAFEKRATEEQQRSTQVNALLERATAAFKRGDIVEPADTGAVTLFKRVLELDPDSAAAERGLAKCMGWYAERAALAIAENDVTRAKRYVTRAKQINSSHPIVRALDAQLSDRDALLARFAERETLLQSETDAARIQHEEAQEALRDLQREKLAATTPAVAAPAPQVTSSTVEREPSVTPQAPAPTTVASTAAPAPAPVPAQPAKPAVPSADIIALGQGIASYYGAEYDKAFSMLEPLAEKGSSRAQFRLSVMYFLGRGAPRDPVTGGAWLNRSSAEVRGAANRGAAWAESDLGQMYEEGWSVPQS